MTALASNPSYVKSGESETPVVRVRSRTATEPVAENKRVWPNGSAVYRRYPGQDNEDRDRWSAEETHVGFIGRIVRKSASYHVYAWKSEDYVELGEAKDITSALLKLDVALPWDDYVPSVPEKRKKTRQRKPKSAPAQKVRDRKRPSWLA